MKTKSVNFKTKSKVRRGRYRMVTKDVDITFGIHEEDNNMRKIYKYLPHNFIDDDTSTSNTFDNNAGLLSYLESGNDGVDSLGRDINLPARPLLISTLAYDKEYIDNNVKLYGRYNEHQYIDRITRQLENDVQEVALNEEYIIRNARYTIYHKGFNYPLKFSGELLNSIKTKTAYIPKPKKVK